MKINTETETTPCKPFSRKTHESAFKPLHKLTLATTTVYLIRPPQHLSAALPYIFVYTSNDAVLRHPLTSKPLLTNLSPYIDLRKLNPVTLDVSNNTSVFDKLLVVPASSNSSILFALYDGGLLRVHLPYFTEWVKLPRAETKRFDDVIFYKGKVYALGRIMTLCVINISVKSRKITVGRTVVSRPGPFGSARFGWRKRVVVDKQEDVMYLVVRIGKLMMKVFKRVSRGKGDCWEEVKGFDGGEKVLFMTRDYYFFRRAKKFPAKGAYAGEYENCIVFTEGAFPEYGNGCWEFSQFSEQLGFECNDEEDVAIFRLGDECFCKEGDNAAFPRIDWYTPYWIFNDEFQSHSSSEPLDSSGREIEEDKGLDSDSKGEKNGEVQFALNDSKSKDEELEGMESDPDSPDEDIEDGKMQCDSRSREKEDVEMHVNANTEDGASLQENVCHVSPSLLRHESGTTDTRTPPLSATEKEITRTLLRLNGRDNATEEETSRKNISELVPKACAFSTSASHKSDSATVKFEGFDIRIDSVSTLEKIWQKHGNIVENSVMRNRDIIAMSLESLATMVCILDDNSPLSLSDSQADYLVSTLSDLRHNHFKVDWLSSSVEKVEKFHKNKPLMESLNSLSQLCSQAMDRRAILVEKLTKLDEEVYTWKEEMSKISKMIPYCGQVKFDEPIGSGLT